MRCSFETGKASEASVVLVSRDNKRHEAKASGDGPVDSVCNAIDRITGLWLFLPIAIFAREFLISGLREFLGPKDVKVPVTFLAKWKTATQMLSLGFLIIGPYAPYALEIGLIFLSIATLLTIITGFSYYVAAKIYLHDENNIDEPKENS